MHEFVIHVPQAVLDDLQERLARTRWPDAIAGLGWALGAEPGYMRQLCDYWLHHFDWRAQERELGRFHHYRAQIDGVGIHYIHEAGRGPRPFPLIITHGWPGSFLEMLELIPRLTDPAAFGADPADAFDVVVPSMPGYGFSDRPSQPGMNTFRIAELWVGLMRGLGYPRFGAQGGDIGANVSTVLGWKHSESVAGIHLNYIPGSYSPYTGPGSRELSAAEKQFLESAGRWYDQNGAYWHQQRTRPQTLAYGLNDSPMGLAAWIVEKFREWADCEGDVERRFTRDQLLANVTLYWVTETIHSSCRLYYEGSRAPLGFQKDERVAIPCAVARFPKEDPFPPREWVERGYNVVRWTEMPRGGHFAAAEEPDMLAEDLRTFFRPLRRG